MITICIIGGGFSGTATAIQLLKQQTPLRIKLINHSHPLARGVAYSTARTEHLLNVPAGKMSLFPDQPGHFTEWLCLQPEYKDRDNTHISAEYVPRSLYGRYLDMLMALHISDPRLEIIAEKAVQARSVSGQYEITLAGGRILVSDVLVLAMGNYLPAAPKVVHTAVFEHPDYFNNPWSDTFLNGLRNDDTILLIGTGLTMVDCVLSLRKQQFGGKIVVVSPRGYLPASHTTPAAYADFCSGHKGKTLQEILQSVREHVKTAAAQGTPWQSVIDAIRPYVQQIWLQLGPAEKQQFVSHLRHIWGVARHRLPESIYAQIRDSVGSGQTQIIGGRIIDIEENKNGFSISIRPRREQEIKKMSVTRIVNCTGPQINYAEITDPLVKSLIENHIIRPDPLKMGIAATAGGQVLDADGQPVKNVYALGSLLRGILWETTAVPDIRVQAERLARQIGKSNS